MDITFGKLLPPKTGAVVVLATEGGLLAQGAELDKRCDGALARAMKAARFKGKPGEIIEILAPGGSNLDRALVMGVGAPAKLDALAARKLGGGLAGRLQGGSETATVLVDDVPGSPLSTPDFAAAIAFGVQLKSYRFDRYQTKRDQSEPSVKKLSVLTAELAPAKKAYTGYQALAEGVFFTRDLVSEPANVLYPASFVERCTSLAEHGVVIEVLGRKEMTKLGMGALLGVAQGSAREPQLLVMQWKGGAEKTKPVAIVGKGVTFDSGGISIKPAAGMGDMKWDMGGAGAVAGLMKTLALRKAKANVIGICALVENMPDGNAQRPGDVVTSMSGQTIEVLNTDAEGRLVLADAVWYTQNRFKPAAIVDLATLTGAIIVTLGHEIAGLFASDDALAAALTAAGQTEGELLWRLPLSDSYDKKINSQIADMANIGPAGQSGSILGAQFIKRFTNDVPWAHLDIAGVVWAKENNTLWQRGGTGFGVALLNRFVADKYEK